MKEKDFTIDGKNYGLYYIKGIVKGKDKHFETKVSGSGGGGGSYNGTGGTAPISISSTTIIHDKLYIEDENGKEHTIELTDWDVACREGHELIVVWIIKEEKKAGSYVAIANLTTQSESFSSTNIRKELAVFMGDLASRGCMDTAFIAVLVSLAAAWLGYLISEKLATAFGIIGLVAFFILKTSASQKVTQNSLEMQKQIKDLLVKKSGL